MGRFNPWTLSLYVLGIALPLLFFAPASHALVFYDSGQALGSYNGFGVALGDLDGDGDLDAFVANLGSQPNLVWINDGSGTFTDSGQALGAGNSTNVALGDLNGDDYLDAFVTNFSSGNEVWLNDGTGTFTDSGQSLESLGSFGVALGDLDGDGDLDAVVANISGGDQIWWNIGGGVFMNSGQSLGTGQSYNVTLGDVDGDGDLDVFVAGQNNKLWLNDPLGTFTDSGQTFGTGSAHDVTLGDLDGDGDLDSFWAYTGNSDQVWLNNGAGTFSNIYQNLGSSFSYSASLGDLDGDGDLDVFVAASSVTPLNNLVWLNNGDGMFTDSGQTHLGDARSNDAALGDLDGDGDLDAFVANVGANRVWLWGWSQLTVVQAGTGAGQVTSAPTLPADIDCPGTCSFIYEPSQTVTLYATASPGSAFTGWSGVDCPGNGSCTVTMSDSYTITATFDVDSDQDNIGDIVEDAGPNSGDGQLDGTLDSFQSHVVTLQDTVGNWWTFVSENTGANFSYVTVTSQNPDPGGLPSGALTPHGYFGFRVQPVTAGDSAVITLILHTQDTTLTDYWKYGPTPDNPANHWYRFMYNGTTGAQITHETDKTYITLHFVDGLTGDDDLAANGEITDMGGPIYNPPISAQSSENNGWSADGGGGCFIYTLH